MEIFLIYMLYFCWHIVSLSSGVLAALSFSCVDDIPELYLAVSVLVCDTEIEWEHGGSGG